MGSGTNWKQLCGKTHVARNTACVSTDLYRSPAVKPPSVDEITQLSEELRLQCSQEDIQDITEKCGKMARGIGRLEQLQQPHLPVTYPCTPIRKTAKDPECVRVWRCDIKGAATGVLSGKTVAVKDSIPVAGVPMSGGSRVLEGYTPEIDATVVTRILDAGGHIKGKSSCEHLCMSGASFSGDNGPVTNPHDVTRTTGGSSSGSAALVACKAVDMALGGDQGGSIRVPASWSGIVGLKPTFSLVPYTGVLCMEPTLDHLGPMANSVTDCALMLEVIAGYDEGRDSRQHPQTVVPEYTKLLDAGVSGKKIGVLKEGFQVVKEKDVADLVREEVYRLRDAGAIVEEVSIPLHLDGQTIWSGITEATIACMIKGNGSGSFRKGFYPLSAQEAMCRGLQTRPQDLSPNTKTFYLWAEYLERNYQNRFYAMAQNTNLVLTKAYDTVLQDYEVLIMPTLPCKAPKMPAKDAKLSELLKTAGHMFPNTSPFNATGHPALSVNAGYSDKLPVGMQIVGRHFDETTIFQVARAFEKLRDKK